MASEENCVPNWSKVAELVFWTEALRRERLMLVLSDEIRGKPIVLVIFICFYRL